MTGNCIIRRSAWCEVSVFFSGWILHPQTKEINLFLII
jgi:hypothetical protein